jgi:hypothetical protein
VWLPQGLCTDAATCLALTESTLLLSGGDNCAICVVHTRGTEVATGALHTEGAL